MGNLTFATPLLLGALLALPAIWWLMRITPPAPQRIKFPPLRFLLGLANEESTPVHTPIWLLILRVVLAALLILGLSGPSLAPPPTDLSAIRTRIIVIDNSWAAASRWDARMAMTGELLREAASANLSVLLVPTASADWPLAVEDADAATARLRLLAPQPFAASRNDAATSLAAITLEGPAASIWLTDGLGDSVNDEGGAEALAGALSSFGPLEIVRDSAGDGALALMPAEPSAQGLTALVRRIDDGPALSGSVAAYGDNGRFLGDGDFRIEAGALSAPAEIILPRELRNAVTRIDINGHASAGAVMLLDDSARRWPVGLVAEGGENAQPLLSDLYYVERALSGRAEVVKGSITDLLTKDIAMLVLADVGRVVGDDLDRLSKWVDDGGMLVRFAGPRLAAQGDDLLPVRLRAGDRTLGGSLSWGEPQGLGPLPPESPFEGLQIPEDVRIRRQVLAEPGIDLAKNTWARLTDGTPLVTAAPRGKGWLVLFHVTANADWSDLPLSGLYVSMLDRLLDLARRPQGAPQPRSDELLAPVNLLDGFGRLIPPSPNAAPIRMDEEVMIGPAHPPGIYAGAASSRALNLFARDEVLPPLPRNLAGATERSLEADAATDLAPALFVLAALLFAADAFASLFLRGLMPRLPRRSTAALIAMAAGALLLMPRDARAQETPPAPVSENWQAALGTHLAYVLTGDAEIDAMSKAGLEGLSRVLTMRTAVNADAPMGVNIETDELTFFPVLYWPIAAGMTPPSPAALARVDSFMKNGGLILFDTREPAGSAVNEALLRTMLETLDIPPLERLPAEHVLNRTFYILKDQPGRFTGGEVWIEAPRDPNDVSASGGDNVSGIVIGANDWASAWAIDEFGRPLAPLSPGGERQREIAWRFGVNLVMYALTGNYKTDQVHVPAFLERLGQ